MTTIDISRKIGQFALLLALLAGVGLCRPAWSESHVIITSGDRSTSAVALTFDDGPSPLYTPKILTLLRQYQARGTFFVLGDKVEKHPQLIQAMVAAGHEVGNHTYSHPRLPEMDHLDRVRELERTRLAIDLLDGPHRPTIFRPPFSDYDARLVAYLRHTDQDLILWNVDSGDWRGLNAGAIVANVLSQVKNGAIIIFHDSDEYGQADRTPTLEALALILPALRQAGYDLVTVSELLAPPAANN